jgi:hypothetical protein
MSIQNLNCLCCNEPFQYNNENFPYDFIVDKIMIGYGSCHDGDVIQICLCDKCITEKIQKGSLIVTGNYFEELSKEPIGIPVSEEAQKLIINKLSD